MKRIGAWLLSAGLLSTMLLAGAYGLPAQISSANQPAAATAPAPLVDINRATAEELKQLPGIADAYAAAIIRNRPYKNKTQLTTRKVIPQAAYRRIRDLIIARQ